MKHIYILIFMAVCAVLVILLTQNTYIQQPITKDVPQIIQPTQNPTQTPTPVIQTKQPETSHIIPMRSHVFQTFNNCGPASLSMLLSYVDIDISQQELGLRLRPYQNQQGDNDDKSVTLDEMAEESKQFNLIPYHRAAGNLELLKLLIANDMPVVVRTWLYPGEDIGHYRLVRGYDDTTGEIIQDDSYEGKNLRFPYRTFLSLWQPFNYELLIVVPKEKDELAKSILKDYTDENKAWENAYKLAKEEADKNPDDFYPIFNQSIAQFHLGNYKESIELFESVENSLPSRMLWYQTEPAEAYLKMQQYDKLLKLTEKMLINNRAFSEIYLMRGTAYKQQGNNELAEQEFEKALFYNVGNQMKQKVNSFRVE